MAAVADANAERRKKVFVGELPPDFLKINVTQKQQQEAADQQAAMALQQYITNSLVQNSVGRLNITVGQAKLVKNYGMTRMDPYVRIRVGHFVFETQTDPNGGKNPHWNKVIQSLLPQGVYVIYVEIYDERSFTVDTLIAFAHIPIPQKVLNGETIEDWYPLNGKQGDGQEGVINLVLSYTTLPQAQCMYRPNPPVMMVPSTSPGAFGVVPQFSQIPVYQLPPNSMEPAQYDHNQNLQQIEEMFPNIEKEVILSVYRSKATDKDATVNALLQMSEG